jgi:TonB-dependent starch-binding outer membrane protein SusC
MQLTALSKACYKSIPVRRRETMVSDKRKQIWRIMKLTVFILLTACFAASASGGYSQITLSEKNAPLQKVFKKIQEQSGYYVLYPAELVRKAGTVTVDVRNVSLEQALKAVLNGKQLSFVISDRTVMIRESEKQLAEQQDPSPSPSIDVRGRVFNDKGEPVKGVTVTVRGTGKATSTDNNGTFTLNNVEPDAVLVFTSVNTETFELRVRGLAELVVTLKNKVTALDDVKIIAYGTTSERLRTGAVNSVKAETIERQPVGNVMMALQGQVPGLNITQSTALPGARVDFNIRGLNSLNPLANFQGSNDPLVIIDGVPFSTDYIILGTTSQTPNNTYTANGGLSTLASINPADIERVDVLKDADATAIYGSRGANGVILITTKTAKLGKPTLTIDLSQGFGKLSRRLDMLSTRQYLDMRYEAYANDGINWQALANKPADLAIWDTTRYTDWQKELLGGTAKFTRANMRYSGGSQQSSYVISTNYWKEGSIFGDQFNDRKFSGSMSFNHRSPNNRFNFDVNAVYTYDDILQPNENIYRNAIYLPPNAPRLYNDDGSLNWENGNFDNPMADFLQTQEITSYNLNSSATFSYKVTKNLTLRAQAGYGKVDFNMVNLTPLASVNPYNSNLSSDLRTGRYIRNNTFNTDLEPQAEYIATAGPGKLTALLGFAVQRRGNENSLIIANKFLSDELMHNYGAASNIQVSPVESYDYRYNAVFARLGYNIQNRYILSLNARRDGSSRFGPGKQFGNFGSAGLAWIFSEEAAIKKAMPFLSHGKIRLSYGTTGSDAIGDYNYLSLYSIRAPLSTFNPPYTVLQPTRLFNPDYHWETKRAADVELSLGFLNNRILATANYYNNRSSNQLIGQALPRTTGFASINGNQNAIVENSGWELQLNTENVKTKNFSWSSNLNVTIPRNRLVAYPDLENSVNRIRFVVGEPVKMQRVYDYIGVDPQTGVNLFRTADGKDTSIMTGSGLAFADQTVYIDLTPKYYGGLSNSFRYKNWMLDFMLLYSQSVRANDISMLSVIPGFQGNITQYVFNNSWRKPGDEALFQRFTQTTNSPVYNSKAISLTENYYSNVWYVRLNNLSLSYDLPGPLLKKLHLASCRLYVNSQNLFTLTNFKGTDPATGVNSMPPLRVLTGGVQLKF